MTYPEHSPAPTTVKNSTAETRPAASDSIDPATRRKVVAASFIGNFVEWFDYAAYGYLAITISAVFFPSEDRQLALMMTFGVFAISFLVRPLGGFIWGHLGDKIGRRTALSWSILLMTGQPSASPCFRDMQPSASLHRCCYWHCACCRDSPPPASMPEPRPSWSSTPLPTSVACTPRWSLPAPPPGCCSARSWPRYSPAR